ncbi:MAG: alginate O-acetyltransferase complex protein AlgI [Saprospiraceae bacterium]|jgi:alginate O-acetyltransferase complex protein AlgI
MFFESYNSFITILLLVGLYQLAKLLWNNVVLKNLLLLLSSSVVLLTIIKEHTFYCLLGLSVLIYFLGLFFSKKKARTGFATTVAVLVCAYAIRSFPLLQNIISNSVLDFLNKPILSVQKIGLSYILFRMIHWLVDSYKKKIVDYQFLTFINYILFFPSFLAGPIDTYNNFQYYVAKKSRKLDSRLFFSGIFRIFLGAFKTLFLVPMLIEISTDYTLLLDDYPVIVALTISTICYSIYIYLDFSGYSDLAIGLAYLFGIKTPENFNSPYLARNISEFWKRWHITFSNFLRLYVFGFFKQLSIRVFGKKKYFLATVALYLLTFLVCGVWHGSTLNFIMWGAWHGLGISIYKFYDLYLYKKLPYTKTSIYKVVSVLCTFLFVSYGWIFFHYSSEQLIEILQLL